MFFIHTYVLYRNGEVQEWDSTPAKQLHNKREISGCPIDAMMLCGIHETPERSLPDKNLLLGLYSENYVNGQTQCTRNGV